MQCVLRILELIKLRNLTMTLVLLFVVDYKNNIEYHQAYSFIQFI